MNLQEDLAEVRGQIGRPERDQLGRPLTLDDGICRFGVMTDRIADPRSLAAILCHEVAHAYRERHGLQYETHEEEESLTDLTTVYLGFGILSANLANWRTSKGHPEYMTQQALCFALAAQAVSRGADRKRISKFLDTNQRAFFAASCEELDRREVWALLGIGKTSPAAARAETKRSFNRGLPVYRIKGGLLRPRLPHAPRAPRRGLPRLHGNRHRRGRHPRRSRPPREVPS